MSPENGSEWARLTKRRYSMLVDLEKKRSHYYGSVNWEEQRPQILKDFQEVMSIRKRLALRDLRIVARRISDVLVDKSDIAIISAAILYPDMENPKLVEAHNMCDNHSDVRKIYLDLDNESMIFGERVILKNEVCPLFVCDSIMLSKNAIELPTRRNYIEVANILLDLGYIPVDAEFSILPITS
jgi:hypothetical protein